MIVYEHLKFKSSGKTHLRGFEKYYNIFVTNFLLILTVKEY